MNYNTNTNDIIKNRKEKYDLIKSISPKLDNIIYENPKDFEGILIPVFYVDLNKFNPNWNGRLPLLLWAAQLNEIHFDLVGEKLKFNFFYFHYREYILKKYDEFKDHFYEWIDTPEKIDIAKKNIEAKKEYYENIIYHNFNNEIKKINDIEMTFLGKFNPCCLFDKIPSPYCNMELWYNDELKKVVYICGSGSDDKPKLKNEIIPIRYNKIVDELKKRKMVDIINPQSDEEIKETIDEINEILGYDIKIPQYYIDFLKDIGKAEFFDGDNSHFNTFSTLLTLEDLTYGTEENKEFDNILFFAGFGDGSYGFDISKEWKIIETDEYRETITPIEESFESFIEQKIFYYLNEYTKNETKKGITKEEKIEYNYKKFRLSTLELKGWIDLLEKDENNDIDENNIGNKDLTDYIIDSFKLLPPLNDVRFKQEKDDNQDEFGKVKKEYKSVSDKKKVFLFGQMFDLFDKLDMKKLLPLISRYAVVDSSNEVREKALNLLSKVKVDLLMDFLSDLNTENYTSQLDSFYNNYSDYDKYISFIKIEIFNGLTDSSLINKRDWENLKLREKYENNITIFIKKFVLLRKEEGLHPILMAIISLGRIFPYKITEIERYISNLMNSDIYGGRMVETFLYVLKEIYANIREFLSIETKLIMIRQLSYINKTLNDNNYFKENIEPLFLIMNEELNLYNNICDTVTQGIRLKSAKEYDKAIEKFFTILDKTPNFAELWHSIGACYCLLNDKAKTKQYLLTAIDKYMKRFEQDVRFVFYYGKIMPGHNQYWASACYSLLNDKENCFKYLKNAIAFNKKWKEYAKSEEDFETIKDEEEFLNIIAD